MKWVIVPSPIQVMSPDTGEPIHEDKATLWEFLKNSVLSCQSVFGSGYKSILATIHLRESFEHAEPGSWVAVEDADHELVLRVLNGKNTPDVRWQPLFAAQMIAFFEAFIEAPSKRPLQSVEDEKTG